MKFIKQKICKKEINKVKELQELYEKEKYFFNKLNEEYKDFRQLYNKLEDRFNKLEASRISEKEQYLKDEKERINKGWKKLQEARDELFFEKSKETKRIENSRIPLMEILHNYKGMMLRFDRDFPFETDSFTEKLFSLFDEMQKQIDQQDELKERLATQTANNIILIKKLNEVKNERN